MGHDRLLLLAIEKLQQGETVQAQQGTGTAVTVVLSRFIPFSGLSSPIIFTKHYVSQSKKCIHGNGIQNCINYA